MGLFGNDSEDNSGGGFLGLFGNSSESEVPPEAAAIDAQIRTNQAELEAKKQSLYKTRLDIIKGEGAQNWTPNTSSPIPPKAARTVGSVGSPFNALTR
jgi:hypothetical protein